MALRLAYCRQTLFVLLAVTILGVSVTACTDSPSPEVRTTSVDVTEAVVEDIPNYVLTVGTLQAREAATARAEVAGRVTEIAVEEGTWVQERSSLLRIDPERYSLNRQRAETQLAQARARFENDSALLERNRTLLEAGAIDPQTLADLSTRVVVGRADMEAQSVALTLAERDLGDSKVPAPFSGHFAERFVDLGDYVQVGDPLGTVVDATSLRLTFTVPETQGVFIKAGDPVAFLVTALPGLEFEGQVYFVSPIVDASTRAMTVKARVPNPDDELLPGMSVSVRVVTSILEGAVVVPDVAVRRMGSRAFVFVVAGGIAQRTEIETGPRPAPGRIVATSGLSVGDSVVVAGFQKLFGGDRVRVRDEERNGGGSPVQ